MTAISLTISAPIEDSVRDTLGDMNEVVTALGIDYVLIGAKARDIVLHHHFGAPLQRATVDIDFAIYVRGWDEFQQTRERLTAKGYEAEREPHRLRSPLGDTIDIVPFGGIEAEGNAIQWPPDGMIVMSVMGFDEACRTAYLVNFEEQPEIAFKVANLESQILLKLIAWTERVPSERRKDADDIAYLLQHYNREDRDNATLWNEAWQPVLMENDYDHTIVAMQLFGQRAAKIANEETHRYVSRLLRDEFESRPLETLAIEMTRSNRARTSTDDCLHWLEMFRRGFQGI